MSRGGWKRLALALAAWPLAGCLGTPSPLAPGIQGSIGMPHDGVQTGAIELPVRGPGFARYRPHTPNDWGNPRLVDAVERAAATVARERPGGAPLVIGDMSARYGGRIPGHASHRNGRDADLLWYVTTPAGAPTRNPGFIHIGSDGLARVGDRYLRLDVEREWLLIKTLLRSPEIGVEWMFCARPVEALIIAYARARGEDPSLVWHAETVLQQPGDSAPHDDHIHLRMACTGDLAVHGCQGGGPYWDWLPPEPRLGPLDQALLESIAQDDPLDIERPVAASADGNGA